MFENNIESHKISMMSSMFPIAYLKLICFGDSHGVGSRAWSFIPFAKLTRVACLATPKYFSGFTQRPAWASDYGDPLWMECCVGWNHDAQWWLLAMLWILGLFPKCETTTVSLTWQMLGNRNVGVKSKTIYPHKWLKLINSVGFPFWIPFHHSY